MLQRFHFPHNSVGPPVAILVTKYLCRLSLEATMKRISFFFLMVLGFLALSACQRRGLEKDEDFNPSNFVLTGADRQLYSANCLGQTGDVALNSSNTSGCRVSSSGSGRQAISFGMTGNISVFNSDFALYFCAFRFQRNRMACLNFFGLTGYQPQPTYQTCNSCVNCPFGGLCPRYCFTQCSQPMPVPVPQPNPYPYPTPTATPSAQHPSCPGLLAQTRSLVQSFGYCRMDSDCASTTRLADRCGDVYVNRQYSQDPALTQAISIYNQICRPTQPIMCTMIATLPSCQNNRCVSNGL